MTPQGNFAAYKELKYRKEDQDNTVDFISLGIDRLIKEGKARDAAKLKLAQDLGKTYYDAIKDTKIEAKQTAPIFQEMYNSQFNKAFDSNAYAKQIALNLSIPDPVRQKAVQQAQQDWKDYETMGTFLGDKDQLKIFTDKLNTDTSKIWRGDEGLKIMNAIKNGAFTKGTNQNNQTVFKYLDPDTNETVENTLGETTQAVMNGWTEELVNKKDGLIDQMRQEATNMMIETENGIGGNRTTKSVKFNQEAAKISFDTRFGEYNLNNDDPYLKQFSYDVLNNKTIQSKEDWDKVKQAYVDRMDGFVKEEKSVVDKYTTAQLEGQNLNNKKTKVQIQKMQEKEQQLAVPTAETSIIRTYNPDGSYQGYYTGKTASVNLAGTTNFLSAHPVEGKDGKVTNRYYIGGFAKDGNIVYEPISNPLTAMTSAKIKDPVKVFAQLNQTAASLPVIKYGTRQKIVPKNNGKSTEYELTSVNIKAKEEQEADNMKELQNIYLKKAVDQARNE